ncbi:hypothetical protein [Mycoplasma anserisalpingitidis]|uniref:hypothetical protein n=1 Tax=Mycoplasma anserisalpingitidis TaxID=519450 RepID=UPI0013C36895|nr:hypothetical protein [Mycoplasma anserisalpingitidis]
MSDNRNWSETFNINSGRLKVSEKFLLENKTPDNLISEERTKQLLENIYKNIIEKIKK